MSVFTNNEFRTIFTQTDPVSTSDEEDFLPEDDDLYEELDFPEWVFKRRTNDWKVSRTQVAIKWHDFIWSKKCLAGPIKTNGRASRNDGSGIDC